MDELLASVLSVVARVASHTSTWAREAAELFDIEVDELAGVLALVAHDRRWWEQGAQAMEAVPTQKPGDGRFGEPSGTSDLKGRKIMFGAKREDDGKLSGRSATRGVMWTRGAIA